MSRRATLRRRCANGRPPAAANGLLKNGALPRRMQEQNPEAVIDFTSVVKLFTPDAGCTCY